jgi:hypothetical protein
MATDDIVVYQRRGIPASVEWRLPEAVTARFPVEEALMDGRPVELWRPNETRGSLRKFTDKAIKDLFKVLGDRLITTASGQTMLARDGVGVAFYKILEGDGNRWMVFTEVANAFRARGAFETYARSIAKDIVEVVESEKRQLAAEKTTFKEVAEKKNLPPDVEGAISKYLGGRRRRNRKQTRRHKKRRMTRRH